MPLFACRKCGCVENTACTNYWYDVAHNKPALCSECDPEIGQWHGEFVKRSAAGMQVDKAGHLWSDGEVANGRANHTVIIGRVADAIREGAGE